MPKLTFSRHERNWAWGRNGGFVPDSADVESVLDIVRVNAYSSRIGHHAPLTLRLSRSDARALAREINRAAKGTK